MLDAKGMSSEDAVKLLKGPKGTSVNISIKRRGYDQLIDLQVTRDEVNIVSVRGFFMIDSETGYLKLGEFTETSNHEVGAAPRPAHGEGHEAAGARSARQPGRRARSGDRHLEPVPAARRHDRLYARAAAELGSGLPRDRAERLHAPAGRRAGEPEQRERLGDRERRAAGSRSRAGRRRNDVRQGAGAVGLQDQRAGRSGADDRALLHAERPVDSAAVGRRVRRIPDLHAARSEGRAAAHPPRT